MTKTKERTIWKELELGFGGGGQFRVLLQLALDPKQVFTKYALVKATGLRTPSVNNQLKVLLELNWVKEYPFTPRTYQISLEKEVVKRLLEFFERMKHVRSSP